MESIQFTGKASRHTIHGAPHRYSTFCGRDLDWKGDRVMRTHDNGKSVNCPRCLREMERYGFIAKAC